MKRGIVWALLLSLTGVGGVWTAYAATFNSSNFSINGNLGDSAGGGQSSTNYQLTSAAGESIVGNGSSGSYKLGQGYVSTLARSLQLNVQPNGLVGQYPFDEDAGEAVWDASAYGNNGKTAQPATRVAGKVGTALSFDGISQAVHIPTTASLKPTTAITVESWIKLNSFKTLDQKIVSSTHAGGFGMNVTGTTSGTCAASRLCFIVYINGAYAVASIDRTVLTPGSWDHVAATYDGTSLVLYVNGTQVVSKPYTGAITHSATAPTCIGAEASPSICGDPAGPDWFDGAIDETKIFSRALSGAEIKAEYQAGAAGSNSAVSLNSVTPGISQAADIDNVVQTDAAGYSLAINQNNNLTAGGTTIPSVSGSIASPQAWSEGTTKGLGFTLYGTNATALPGAWNAGTSYAALPASSTAFYTRTGYTGGVRDTINMRLRLDTPQSQLPGNYSNQITIVGTMTP